MKKNVFFVVMLGVVLTLGTVVMGCATTNLDIKNIIEPVEVLEASIVVNTAQYTDAEAREYFLLAFSKGLQTMTDSLSMELNLQIDTNKFAATINDVNFSLEFKEMTFGNMTVRKYYWKSSEVKNLHASLTVTATVIPDKGIPVTCIISNIDPKTQKVVSYKKDFYITSAN
jgi:hypothetical protein